MSAIHDVLRRLNARAPHSTQQEHDEIAALIDQDEDNSGSGQHAKKES